MDKIIVNIEDFCPQDYNKYTQADMTFCNVYNNYMFGDLKKKKLYKLIIDVV